MAIFDKNVDIDALTKSGDADGLNIKIYAHEIEFGGKNASIFEDEAYTIVYIKNVIPLDVLMTGWDIETTFEADNSIPDGQKLKIMNISSFDCVGTINLLEYDANKTYLITTARQLNVNDFLAKKQRAYLIKKALPAEFNAKEDIQNKNLRDAVKKIEESTNATAYELVDLETTNSTKNSVIVPVYNSKKMNIKTIRLRFDSSYIPHIVKAFNDQGIVELFDKGWSFYQNKNVFQTQFIKLSPVVINENLTLYSSQYDYWQNLSSEMLIQKFGIHTFSLRSFFLDNNSATNDFNLLWQLLLAIIELTRAFQTNFKDYQITDNNGQPGIDPNATIGGNKIGTLAGLSLENAQNAVDGWIESFMRDHSTIVNSILHQRFLSIIGMLSNYISSSYAVNNGLNNENQRAMAFTFALRSSITKGIADHSNNDLTVFLQSAFYKSEGHVQGNTHQRQMKLLPNNLFNNVSSMPIINASEKIMVTEIKDDFSEVNIGSRPGSLAENVSDFWGRFPVLDKNLLDPLKFKIVSNNTKILVSDLGRGSLATHRTEDTAKTLMGDDWDDIYSIYLHFWFDDKFLKVDFEHFSSGDDFIPLFLPAGTNAPSEVSIFVIVKQKFTQQLLSRTINENFEINEFLLFVDSPHDSSPTLSTINNDKPQFLNNIEKFANSKWSTVDKLMNNSPTFVSRIAELKRQFANFRSLAINAGHLADVKTNDIHSSNFGLGLGFAPDQASLQAVYVKDEGIIKIYKWYGYKFDDIKDSLKHYGDGVLFPNFIPKDQNDYIGKPENYAIIKLRFIVSFSYVVGTNILPKQQELINLNKERFINLHNKLLPFDNENIFWELEPKNSIHNLKQIILKGFWGNEFSIELINENNEKFVTPKLPFTSKFDETKGIVKINC